MNKLIMLTIIFSLFTVLLGCKDKDNSVICLENELYVNGECIIDQPYCSDDYVFVKNQCFKDVVDAIYLALEQEESNFIEKTENYELENSIIKQIHYHYIDGIIQDYIYLVEYIDNNENLISYLVSFDNFGIISSFIGVSNGDADNNIDHFNHLETKTNLVADQLPNYQLNKFDGSDLSVIDMFDSFDELVNYHQNVVLLEEFNQSYEGYYSFYIDDVYRKYKLYIPNNIEANAPLVMALHGFTGSSDTIKNISGFNALADEYGFAVVYPLGSDVPGIEISHWNSGLDYSEVDDVEFLTELVSFLQGKFILSEENTFVTGFSNGGFMSYTLACEANETFKAYATVSGLMSKETWDTCDMSPTPLLHIHGSLDDVVPIDGTMLTEGGWGGAPELSVILDAWNEINGNTLVEEVALNEVTNYYKYSNELNKNYIWYYEVKTYNHIWPGSIDRYVPIKSETAGFDASMIIWEFFSNQIE